MVFLFLLINIIFIIYFIYIKIRYLSLIPILILLIWIFMITETENNIKKIKTILIKNSLFTLRLILNLWISLIINYFWIWIINILWFLLNLNIWLFLFSLALNKEKYINIYHLNIYIIIIIIITFIKNYEKAILIFSSLLLWIYAFIFFIIWNFSNIWKKYINLFIFYLIFTLFLFIYVKINKILAILFLQFILIFYLFTIYIIKIYKKESNILEKILKWEKVFTIKRKINIEKIIKLIKNHESNLKIKFIFPLLNLIIITYSLLFIQNNLVKLIILIIFIINFLLIKQLNYNHEIQRLFLYWIVNIWIFSILTNNSRKIWEISVIWTIITTINTLLVYLFYKKILEKKILYKEDIYIRIITNIINAIINSFFIYQINIDLQLKIWIILVYLSLTLFLNINLYNKIK